MHNLFKWTRGFSFLMDEADGGDKGGGGAGGKKEGDKGGEGGDDKVDKAAFEKVMGEKKNAMKKINELEEKLNALLKDKEDGDKKSLAEQGKYKELYEKSLEDLKKVGEKYSALDSKLKNGAKAAALRKEFNKLGQIDDKQMEALMKMVDMEGIKFDDEHNLVFGAEEEAKRLFETFPAAFGKKDPGMKHDQGGGTTKNLTVEQWQALSPKERAKIPLSDLYKGAGITVKK